jgi:hypothetical protein
MVSTIVFVFDLLVYWSWMACIMPATFCWNCLATCFWATVATSYYMCVFWCILHLNEYFPKQQATLSSGSRTLKKAPSLPAAPSLAGNDITPHAAAPSLTAAPVAVLQQHDEADAVATTSNSDNSSPTKAKTWPIESHAGPTRSDDSQGQQDTAAAAPSPPTVEVPPTPAAAPVAAPTTPTAAMPPSPTAAPVAQPPTPTAAASPAPIAVAVPANPTVAGAPPAAAPELGICDKEAAIMAVVIRFNQEMRNRGLYW